MRRTKEEAEQTKKDILHAATQIFSAKSVAKTTLEDIARAAGVTRGAIYWHFKNKKEIFDALYEALHRPLIEVILDDLEKDHPNPLQQLEELCVQLFVDLDKDEQKKQALKLFLVKCDYSGEMEQFKQKHDEKKKEKQQAFCRFFEKAKKKGKLSQDSDPALLTVAISSYMRGIVHEYMDNPGRFNMQKDAQKLMRIFFKGLGT